MDAMDSSQHQVPKVSMFLVFIRILITVTIRLFSSPFKGKKGAPSYFKDVMYAAMRTMLDSMTIAMQKATDTPTEETYYMFCAEAGQRAKHTELPHDCKAFWFGKTNAEKLIVYFHGGGYVAAAMKAHFQWGLDLVNKLNKKGHSVAYVALAYTTAPEAQYPTQLQQAVELIRYLIEEEQRDPSTMVLAGDSAGGNLILGILSHIAHPHPSIPKLTIPTPFLASLLNSPWVSFDYGIKSRTSSIRTNSESDFISPKAVTRWHNAFLGSSESDEYTEPLKASVDWWTPLVKGGVEGVPEGGAVKEVMIWGGGGEILLDSIKDFSAKFTEAYEKEGKKDAVFTIITPRAAHIESIMDLLLGYSGDADTTTVLKEWVASKL